MLLNSLILLSSLLGLRQLYNHHHALNDNQKRIAILIIQVLYDLEWLIV